jgi:hypothetical protein
MLKPNDPSPCCKDKGGKLARANPDTHVIAWDPTTQTGKLYCSACHREFEVKPNSKRPTRNV